MAWYNVLETVVGVSVGQRVGYFEDVGGVGLVGHAEGIDEGPEDDYQQLDNCGYEAPNENFIARLRLNA
ncbi:hypothetical protein PK28_10285 [Hymenobacter sp. DG25B]|nr:hypothetical protein PK28_10285 [Hymenobacter sp. DG25B]